MQCPSSRRSCRITERVIFFSYSFPYCRDRLHIIFPIALIISFFFTLDIRRFLKKKCDVKKSELVFFFAEISVLFVSFVSGKRKKNTIEHREWKLSTPLGAPTHFTYALTGTCVSPSSSAGNCPCVRTAGFPLSVRTRHRREDRALRCTARDARRFDLFLAYTTHKTARAPWHVRGSRSNENQAHMRMCTYLFYLGTG